ncbi:hypothetical protein ACQKNB_01035 [Lysinibacillus xylanilyticus]|uniref:hypothetical protein n=1 Tax=Lysinibacillus xylanilyticus TaxID=582475 RepID=UPI003D02CEBB
MDQKQFDAIKERVAKATPGPWLFSNRGNVVLNNNYEITEGFANKLDGLFIANARKDVPALVAEVDRLKAEKEQWFKRESILQKEIERLQAIEIESDSKLCERKKVIKRLHEALEKVMEAEEPIMEGWETSVYKIAREALGGEAHE